MAVDKSIDYVVQDGYNNYTKNSDSVTVPRKFKARKNAPATKLAYITDAEEKQLKKQNPGTPHKGPSNVPSYDSFDAQGNYSTGAAMSAAETGGKTDRDRRDMAASGISPQEAREIRAAAINAGAGQRVNPGFFDSKTNLTRDEMQMARDQRRNDPFARGAYRNTRGGIMNFIQGGGLLGALLSGIGSLFGLGKRPGEATYDMSEFSDLGLLTDRVNPTFQNDLGNELMLSTQKTPERFLPNAGPKQAESYGLQNYNSANNEIPFQPYYNFNTYGTAEAAVPTDMLAPTPVETFRDNFYTGIQENFGKPISNFLNTGMDADTVAALENKAIRDYRLDSATGPVSDFRHMAALNELSKTLSPMDNRVGEFIGDTLAYGAGLINEVPALFRGLNKENLAEIKEDLAANYAGTYGTPQTMQPIDIYNQVFGNQQMASTGFAEGGIASLSNRRG